MEQQRPTIRNEDVKEWIKDGPNQNLIGKAEAFGKELKNGKLSTSQIRQVFTRLKGIEARGYREKKMEFLMLKPLMAYAASRQNAKGLQLLKKRISTGIDQVVSAPSDEEAEKRFKNFVKFFEAVLAYFRAAGGN